LCIQVLKQRMGIMPGAKWKTPTTEQTSSYLDKVNAMAAQQNRVVVRPPPTLPRPSFSSGLEKYAKYRH